MAARGLPLGEKYAVVLIECLTSSKSETRSAALSLLNASVVHGVVSLESIKKATERLKPALQRSVGSLIAKMTKGTSATSHPEGERLTPVKPISSENGDRVRSRVLLPTATTQNRGRRNEELAVPAPVDFATHPLIPHSSKHVEGSTRSITWPEYPEEPHGSVLENLKRFWAPFLPPATVSILFPSSGIKKQDDAKGGIEALARALSMDRATGGGAIAEQLDLVFKWVTFVLCSKESTTGLHDILSLLKDIFSFMLYINREFTDAEALETIPFLLDKASSAKVRLI